LFLSKNNQSNFANKIKKLPAKSGQNLQQKTGQKLPAKAGQNFSFYPVRNYRKFIQKYPA